MRAAFTFDTADTERKFAFFSFYKTLVITVDGKTSGVPARAGKLVKLKICNEIVIKIWC